MVTSHQQPETLGRDAPAGNRTRCTFVVKEADNRSPGATKQRSSMTRIRLVYRNSVKEKPASCEGAFGPLLRVRGGRRLNLEGALVCRAYGTSDGDPAPYAETCHPATA